MTDKPPKTKAELEALALVELRAASQCGGALHVPVVPFDDYRMDVTWEVASAMRTQAPEVCERVQSSSPKGIRASRDDEGPGQCRSCLVAAVEFSCEALVLSSSLC